MKKLEKNKGTLLKVLQLIKPYGSYIILSLFLALVTVAATLYTPILIGNGVDMIVGPGQVNYAGLMSMIVTFLVIMCCCSWDPRTAMKLALKMAKTSTSAALMPANTCPLGSASTTA